MIEPYEGIVFPEAPADRPYVFINMVATIDGKIVSGTRDEDVMDLGSKADHRAMARLDAASDAVLIGARTLRASPRDWRPRGRLALVVSRSGDLPTNTRYLTGDAAVIAPGTATFVPPTGVRMIHSGHEEIDWPSILKSLRTEEGVERLYVLGGSDLNAHLLAADLVDELFLTVAPKIRLGTDLPTYAGGQPLPRGGLLDFRLIESHVVEDEVFVRYRRRSRE